MRSSLTTTTAIPEAATFHLKSAEVRDLTPEFVKEFHELEGSPTERDLNQKRLDYLEERMEAGQLITFHWAIADVDGKRYRVNGQHSSEVLSHANGKFPTGLKVHLDEYKVPNLDGLALLFRQFDARGSGRSPADVSGAYQMLQAALQDVPKGPAKLAAEGISWYIHTVMGGVNRQGDDRYMIFNDAEMHPFIRWIGELFSIKTPEMKNVQVIAAIYATFEANEAEARLFWEQVARGGDEYNDDAPASALDTWLKKFKEDRKLEKPKPVQFYQGCIFAWNAYREGKTIKQGIKYDASKGVLEPTH